MKRMGNRGEVSGSCCARAEDGASFWVFTPY